MSGACGRLTGACRRPGRHPVPAPALKVVLGAEMATDMVLASQRVLPAKLTASGFVFANTDLGGALPTVLGTG